MSNGTPGPRVRERVTAVVSDSARWGRWSARVLVGVVATCLALVLSAPVGISSYSLVDWGRERLALFGGWAFLVPLALEAAVLLCLALWFHATLHGDSASGPRALAWGLAAVSAWANHRHGLSISPDAAVFLPLMPFASMFLVEMVVRRLRRRVLARLGAVEPPLPRFRLARWVVSPRETPRAWATAVREGITNPADALAVVRGRRVVPAALRPGEGDVAAGELVDVAGVSKGEALRKAFAAIGSYDTPAAVAWLAERGVQVDRSYAHTVAKREADSRRRELHAVGQ